ncbi:MAG TPA: IclR family transcriptional regulator [Solirubrobacteraceae bacterium]|nr:IclR family transcriptional regulator [Solirubrobacteraceae bacterium]
MGERAQTSHPAASAAAEEPGAGAAVRPGRASGERETSIRRGIEVLLSLASDESLGEGGLGVTRIAELLGREKSQVSRALKALNEYGLVERGKDNGYRLGWRLYALAQLAGERRLLETARPVMRRLAHSLGERVHLSVLQGLETITLLSESPGRTVQATGWAGRMTPAYCTASGRVLMLDWGDDEIRSAYADVEFVAVAPRTLRSAEALVSAVARAREAGWAMVDEEFEPDLISVAVPVRDPSGTIIAALNASAPRHRFVERVDAAARELLDVAAEITRALGDPAATAGD